MIEESHNSLMETLEGSHALDILNYSPTKRKVEYHHSLPHSIKHPLYQKSSQTTRKIHLSIPSVVLKGVPPFFFCTRQGSDAK